VQIFQRARGGKNSTIVQAGGNITGNAIGTNSSVKVRGTGNRTAGAGSYNNVFSDNSSISITQAGGVTVKQRAGRVDIGLPKGYVLYINGEQIQY